MSAQNHFPILIDAKEAARLCGVSRSLWYKLQSAGRLPKPKRLGRRVLWVVDDIRAWLSQPGRD